MVSMFIEAVDSFTCEPSTERKDEIVVRKLSFNFSMRDADLSVERIDVRNFCLDEVDSSAQH